MVEERSPEQTEDDEAFAAWEAEHLAAKRWKALAKKLWRELHGKVKDGEASQG